MNSLSILIIPTTHATMGNTDRKTGLWFDELTTPYSLFADAGAAITLATLFGGPVPIDPTSLQGSDGKAASVERFEHDTAAMEQLRHTKPLNSISIDDYDVVFLPGGHGAMWDLPNSQALGDLLTLAWARGKVISAVCHGPAGLVQAKDINGHPLVAGKRVSAFTNAEEEATGLAAVVPFLLESTLRELGADMINGPDFQPKAERDGNLVTGQNPASAELVARLVLETL